MKTYQVVAVKLLLILTKNWKEILFFQPFAFHHIIFDQILIKNKQILKEVNFFCFLKM